MQGVLVLMTAGVALVLVMAALVSFPVMWCFNAVMVPIFGLPAISVWQAFALYLLAHLLFGDTSAKVSSN